jgi:hypothetical protein
VCTPSGGQHIYFADPGGIRPSVGQVGPGLDIRADGSYVLAAGNDGYDVDELAPPARMPAWLERLARGRAAPRQRKPPRSWVQMLTGPIVEGGRNDALTRLCGHLLARGIDPRVTAALLAAVNDARCRPRLDAQEVERIVASITRREQRKGEVAA